MTEPGAEGGGFGGSRHQDDTPAPPGPRPSLQSQYTWGGMRQRRVLEYSQFKVHGPGRGLWSQSLTIQRPSCRGMSSPALGGCPETPGSGGAVVSSATMVVSSIHQSGGSLPTLPNGGTSGAYYYQLGRVISSGGRAKLKPLSKVRDLSLVGSENHSPRHGPQ